MRSKSAGPHFSQWELSRELSGNCPGTVRELYGNCAGPGAGRPTHSHLPSGEYPTRAARLFDQPAQPCSAKSAAAWSAMFPPQCSPSRRPWARHRLRERGLCCEAPSVLGHLPAPARRYSTRGTGVVESGGHRGADVAGESITPPPAQGQLMDKILHMASGDYTTYPRTASPPTPQL